MCPLFFRLGQGDTLVQFCSDAKFKAASRRRCSDADEACDAALVGGPAALAWSRFDAGVRARVRARYAVAIEPWRRSGGCELPGEFVLVAAVARR